MIVAALKAAQPTSQLGGGDPTGQGTVIVCAGVQLLNTSHPIVVTLAGIVRLVRFVVPENAHWPIDVTLAGIIILVRPLSMNALMSIVVSVLPGAKVTGPRLAVFINA